MPILSVVVPDGAELTQDELHPTSPEGEGGTCSNNYKPPVQRYDTALVPNANAKEKMKGSWLHHVSDREVWLRCSTEMTRLCEEALRRHGMDDDEPLEQQYIISRLDTDDPMEGYMVRSKEEGWLQGFVTMTTFTTWTHFFKWDSKASMSGMRSARGARKWDSDNKLGSELEQQERHGDPSLHGVMWPRLAEISLIGALGCGGWLLQFFLEQATREGKYDYIVLQAAP